MKKFNGVIVTFLMLFLLVSCEDAFGTLAKIGSALDKTGVNVFGLDKKEAQKTADEVTTALFGSDDGSSSTVLTTTQTTSAIDDIYIKNGDAYEVKAPGNLKKSDGKLDYNVVTDAYLKGFILDDEAYKTLLENTAKIKSEAAKEAFAKSMAEPFYAKPGDQPIPQNVVSDFITEFKKTVSSDNDPQVTQFIIAIIDASITEDGRLKKAGVLMFSAIATVVDKVFTKGAELQGVSKSDFDLDQLTTEQQKQLAEETIVDLKNLHSILLTAVGYNSDAGVAINKLLTGAFTQ